MLRVGSSGSRKKLQRLAGASRLCLGTVGQPSLGSAPGAYTVHVASELIDVRNRDVLIEVYTVPEDVFD